MGVWLSPRTSFTKLYIKVKGDDKEAYYGIYEIVEPIDKSFIKNRFSKTKTDDNGFLWKCLWGANLLNDSQLDSKIGMEDIDPLDDKNSKTYPYDLKIDKKLFNDAKSDIKTFISNLNSLNGDDFSNFIENNFDYDQFLKLYATSVMVGMWDDFWANNGNNYYLYYDKLDSKKWYFIPYDYDNTLGISQGFDTGTRDVMKWGDTTQSVLIEKILNVEKFRNLYKNYIRELCDPNRDLFDPDKSKARIENWQSLISPYMTGIDVTSNSENNYNKIDDSSNISFSITKNYKLLSGEDSGNGDLNYFKVRIKNALNQIENNSVATTTTIRESKPDGLAPKWLGDPNISESYWDNSIYIYGYTNEKCEIFYMVVKNSVTDPTVNDIIEGKSSGGEVIIKGTKTSIQTNSYDYSYSISLNDIIFGNDFDYTVYLVARDFETPKNSQTTSYKKNYKSYSTAPNMVQGYPVESEYKSYLQEGYFDSQINYKLDRDGQIFSIAIEKDSFIPTVKEIVNHESTKGNIVFFNISGVNTYDKSYEVSTKYSYLSPDKEYDIYYSVQNNYYQWKNEPIENIGKITVKTKPLPYKSPVISDTTIIFRYKVNLEKDRYLVGDFNNWGVGTSFDKSKWKMNYDSNTQTYSIEVNKSKMPSVTLYAFMMILDINSYASDYVNPESTYKEIKINDKDSIGITVSKLTY